MTPKLALLDHQTIVVSPSQLEIIRTCPRMWLYRYLYRRVEGQPDAAKEGGSCLDEALNLRYKRLGSAPVDPATEADMLALVDKAYQGVELPLEEWRTPARYKEVIQAYNAHWKAEPFKVLGVQVPFKVVLGYVSVSEEFWQRYYRDCQHDFEERPAMAGECGLKCQKCGGHGWKSDFTRGLPLLYDRQVCVVVQGLLDIFGQLLEHVMVIDTKTASNDIGDSYANSAQIKCYMWALQELARLHPKADLPPKVHGAFINGIIVRRPYKQQDRTPTAKDKPRNEFVRTFPTFYSQERLEEWRRDSLAWVEAALGWFAKDHFPANERHCTFHMDAAFKNYGYYGKPCPYLQVDQLPAEQREMALASDAFMDYDRGPLGDVATKGEVAP